MDSFYIESFQAYVNCLFVCVCVCVCVCVFVCVCQKTKIFFSYL